jgi:uncharacterized protein (TIGR02453 family)
VVAFRGWPAEAIEFYEGLQADNSKAYWHDHKAVYEQCVQAPMQALLADLTPQFGEGRIFRPYRDVRFSADKSPYKTNIAATLGHAGYLHLSADGLGVGSGTYMMASDQLARYRQSVVDDHAGAALVGLVETLIRAGIEVSAHESLKTTPRGYPKDHARADLLRHKGLIAWKQWAPAAWLGTAQAKKRVVDVLQAAVPLNQWLAEHVGASETG